MRVDIRECRGLLLLLAGTAAALAGATVVDFPLTKWLGENGWPAFCEFMGQSLFAGEGPGGGDPVVFFIMGVFCAYALSLRPAAPEKLAAWRPVLGFMVLGSLLSALVYVHALKWLVGRARPYLVFEGQRAFTNWYEIGPHFITEGIYHGSFTSGHTTQVFVLMALAYALAGNPFGRRGQKTAGWLVGALAIGYALTMGLARCMTQAHWVTDIAGSIAMSWVTLHVLYYYILNVPRQQRCREALAQSGELGAGWEMLLGFYMTVAALGVVASGIGLHALWMPDARWLGFLLVAGIFLAAWGIKGSVKQIRRLYRGFGAIAKEDPVRMARNPGEIESATRLTVSACRRRGWLILGGLVLFLTVVTAVLTVTGVDLKVAAHFYDPVRGWYLGHQQPWQWLYQYGTIPGLVVTLAALAGWFVTRMRPNLAVWRPYCLLVVFTALVASGILVNAVLKQYWGRPRPDQVTQFGGQWNYRDIHNPGTPGKGSSFPCGHCAMGFTLLSMFGLKRRSRLLAYAGGGAGIVLGGALSITRVVQGAHFVTDTLWSLGLNLITVVALYYLVLAIPAREGRAESPPVDRGRRLRLMTGLAVCLLAAVAAFATRRPFYHTYPYRLEIPPDVQTLIVRINTDPERFNVNYRESGPAQVRLDAHGFGWMRFDHRVSYVTARAGKTLVLTYRVDPVSYFAELYHALDLRLPAEYQGRLEIRLASGKDPHSREKIVQ